MPIEKIIVLDDDIIIRKNLEQQLRALRYDVVSCATIAAAQEYLAKDSFDLLIADVRLPDGDARDLLQQLKSRPSGPLIIMISGFGTVDSAIECMRNGAFDYLLKPFSAGQLEITIKKADLFTRLVKVNEYYSREDKDEVGYELLGNSPAMENLRCLIRKVARTQATVLIQGESGTGKELVARALHRQSPRANAPFIKVNCAAIPENLIESEFFGHEKGAFTGAINKREGRFELAHNGTILLDEVSEVSPTVQAKLLRVLQEREFERVGGNRTIKVDVRVIATTNRNLKQCVEKNEFRQDLYFRLNVVPIFVPPLREHKEDIPLLAEQFMHRFSRKHGVKIQGISSESMEILLSHDWPGNVRELQNVIERAVIMCADGDTINPEHLGIISINTRREQEVQPSAVKPAQSQKVQESMTEPPKEVKKENFPTLDALEKEYIFKAIELCNGNRTHAARLLGISVRTLRNKLNEYSGNGAADGENGDSEDNP
ncbi:MAG: sigma-54-dependent transcriptional regulator [Verrucomicrobiia bacterium]|jgi:DNA-binding NtrC family response regulator